MIIWQFNFKNKLKLIVFLIILLTISLGYWAKSVLGIDLINSVSLSSYFPFKFFSSSGITKSSKRGILLYENFDEWRIKNNWSNLWMQEKGKVTKEVSMKGIGNSKCLLIINRSNMSWSYSSRQLIEVRKGDNFYFSGFVKIEGQNAFASMGVSAYDKNRKIINWNYVRRETNKIGMWVRIDKHFKLAENIKYIRFKISGFGAAKFLFDDIYFEKL